MEFEPAIIDIFIAESKDLLHKVEHALLQIEQGDHSVELINSIFRIFHNLKGSSAMFESQDLTGFLHELENALVVYKTNNLALPDNKVAILLQAVDCLNAMLDEGISKPFSSATSSNVHNIIAKLKANSADVTQTTVVEAEPKILSSNLPVQPRVKNIASANLGPNIEVKAISKNEDKTFIKVDPKKLDEIINLIGELVLMQSNLNAAVKLLPANIQNIVDGIEKVPKITWLPANLQNIVDNTEKLSNLIELLGGLSLQLRMVPVKTILNKFNRMVRDLAIKSNKQIKLAITGEDIELDKSILEKLHDPLVHLLRNACDHGIDSLEQRVELGKPVIGSLIIKVAQHNNEALITVTDDGRGIDLIKIKNKAITLGLMAADANLTDQELINFIFRSGFSTAEQVTEISGRGVGMDIVKKEVEKLHGSITVTSKIKQGTTIALRLPLTLAIIKGLLIKIDNFLAVIPVWNVVECVQINSEQYQQILTKRRMNFRNTLLPGLILSKLLGIGNQEPSNIVVIVNYADYQVGIVVDDLLGEVQAVIKNTPEMLSDIAWFNGATILGNGQVAVILDIPRMIATLDNTNLNNCKVTA